MFTWPDTETAAELTGGADTDSSMDVCTEPMFAVTSDTTDWELENTPSAVIEAPMPVALHVSPSSEVTFPKRSNTEVSKMRDS